MEGPMKYEVTRGAARDLDPTVDRNRSKSSLEKLVDFQIWLSERFDKLMPESFCIDGSSHFAKEIVPPFLKEGITVYDIGGGRCPLINLDEKTRLNLTIYGLDISKQELRSAPTGVYDKEICADITNYRGNADGDLVICQAVLEHVRDVDAALSCIRSILKRGGTALLFIPSRNAAYARINLVIPEGLKRRLLFGRRTFRAYYNRCTPRDFRNLTEMKGFKVVQLRPYFTSSYFAFFPPLYFVWRLWILLFYLLRGEQAAETFSMAIMKT